MPALMVDIPNRVWHFCHMPVPKGTRIGGRQKGTGNKRTEDVKQAIELVAQGLGGHQGMLAWAAESAENMRLFWATIYPKLLPHTVNATVTHDPIRAKD